MEPAKDVNNPYSKYMLLRQKVLRSHNDGAKRKVIFEYLDMDFFTEQGEDFEADNYTVLELMTKLKEYLSESMALRMKVFERVPLFLYDFKLSFDNIKPFKTYFDDLKSGMDFFKMKDVDGLVNHLVREMPYKLKMMCIFTNSCQTLW
uniref:DNA-directed DNA polymerase n=1 Tax=Rhabditophanes sp. KR3021 TaxID=114890 RepID=A0AC35U7M3_9BILA